MTNEKKTAVQAVTEILEQHKAQEKLTNNSIFGGFISNAVSTANEVDFDSLSPDERIEAEYWQLIGTGIEYKDFTTEQLLVWHKRGEKYEERQHHHMVEDYDKLHDKYFELYNGILELIVNNDRTKEELIYDIRFNLYHTFREYDLDDDNAEIVLNELYTNYNSNEETLDIDLNSSYASILNGKTLDVEVSG